MAFRGAVRTVSARPSGWRIESARQSTQPLPDVTHRRSWPSNKVGESTCTLGEAKNRCDLVVFWDCDPVNSHPRHGERYSVDPTGLFLPRGREDRFVIVINFRRTDSAQLADWFIQLKKGNDFEVIL